MSIPQPLPSTASGAGSRLWFVGALPPPLHGQSNANRAMLTHLAEREPRIVPHDTGGTGMTKLGRTLRAIVAVAFGTRRGDRAYLSVPGQNGVWLFALLALVLRLRGIEHVVHHHSFRPINLGPTRAMRTLVAAGGRRQHHVLLSEGMRYRFADLYLAGEDDRAMTLSNAYLFGPRFESTSRPDRPVTLGHLSVLTREKGVAYLLGLFAMLVARGHDWKLVIAGPCADPVLAAELEAAQAAHPGRIDWRGAVEGAAKERFFADIDLFVLPTTLIDEAEPLVMLEAFARGVDVVANDMGCIRDRVRTSGHLLTRDHLMDAGLVELLVLVLARDWDVARRGCIDHARAIAALAKAEAARFFPVLLGTSGNLPAAPPV